jgi:4-carboxymuconolactone decarboxylase
VPPRLPFVDPSDAPEPVREALGAAPAPLGLFRIVAHADTAFAPWLRYSATLLSQLELDPLLRELAILQVAKLAESEYEWTQHTGITRAVGGSDEQIAAVEAGEDDAAAFNADQSAVLRLTRSVISEGAGTEEQVHDLRQPSVRGRWSSCCSWSATIWRSHA